MALGGDGNPTAPIRPEGGRTSHDAGSYVCESTYWALLAYRLLHGYPRYAAFLHVPPVSESFPVRLTATAVGGVLECAGGGGAVRASFDSVYHASSLSRYSGRG